jgi:hypothetical protein
MALGLLTSALAIGGQLIAGKKAKKASKAANRAQRALTKLKNDQAKRAFLRNFRQAQAAALVSGVGAGVDISSSLVQGTLASQEAQKGTALKEFATAESLGAAQTAALDKQASANFASSVFGAVGSFASSAGGGSFLDQAF